MGMTTAISISQLSVKIKFDDTITDAKNLVASFTLSPGCEAYINGVKQVSGVTKNNFDSYLNYSIKNADGVVKHWIITATNNTYTADWGMGNFLKQSFTNNKTTYNWYISQAGTGTYSLINCGPTSVTMAMKWVDSTFYLTPQDARNYYPLNTDLWGYSTIQDYLSSHSFQNKYVPLGRTNEESLNLVKKEFEAGNIIIFGLDMYAIRPYSGAAADPRVDRYYPDAFNHFVVAYGYIEIDNEVYFQVNDPWNFGWVNNDGSPKGQSRFYRYEDVFTGMQEFQGFVVINKK